MSKVLARRRWLFRMSLSQDTAICAPSIRFSTCAARREKSSSPQVAQPEAPPGSLFRYVATDTHSRVNDRHSTARQSGTARASKDGSAPAPPDEDIVAMLAKPTWSVRSLLPPENPTQTITQAQLHHLLRLSALPLPRDAEEEEKMLKALHAQLHFVGDIQKVNTDGVEPLVRIAEETEVARREATIGLDDLREALDKEVVQGRNRRSRRLREQGQVGEGEEWDVFSTAGETVEVPGSGRYFVVRSGKGNGETDGE